MKPPPHAPRHERAYLLAAAGLLHDAGKVLQPARWELPENISRLEPMLCPTDRQSGRGTHRHVLYSAFAIDQAESNFGGLDLPSLFRIACYHHRPGATLEEHLLTKADWMASGHDRRPAADPVEAVAGLQPVLARLCWPQVDAQPQRLATVPTSSLAFEREAFLPGEVQDMDRYRASCQELGSRLLKALHQNFRDPADCIDGLLGITERLFHAVPASRDARQQPDVTLFDHSRIVAAFAACLAVLYPEGPSDAHQLHGRYRLVSVSLGGIQKFLVRSIPPLDALPGDSGQKGLAKRLRARSFYVSLLTWLSARRLLDATGFPTTNLLVDAGGRAILLFPDTPATLAQLQQAGQYLESWFHERLGGHLRLDFAISEPLTDESFLQEQFAATFRASEASLQRSRLRNPFPWLVVDGTWQEQGWVASDLQSPIDSLEFQEQMTDWGQALPRAAYLGIDSGDFGIGAPHEVLGYRITLHETRPASGRCWALNVPDDSMPETLPLFLAAGHVPRATGDDLRRLAKKNGEREEANRQDGADRVGDLLTFSDIARLASDAGQAEINQPMLGVLKADVDRLGLLLGYGLGDRVSFGRFASMARSLDLFFKGFLTRRMAKEYPKLYTVFAGGDDLFLLGPWYDVVRFTQDLRVWFDRMTCGNPNVTFSAGIIFAKPHTPVRLLAEQAEQALEKAKEPHRNQISVGPLTFGWPQFHAALEMHQTLRSLATRQAGHEPELSPSLLYRLLQYSKMATRHSPADLKWRAQLNYDLRRNLKDPARSSSELRKFHEQLLSIRTVADAGVLQLATSLTLYVVRGG